MTSACAGVPAPAGRHKGLDDAGGGSHEAEAVRRSTGAAAGAGKTPMKVLQGFLYFASGLIAALTALAVWALLWFASSWSGWMFFPAAVVAAGGLALSLWVFRSARRFVERERVRSRERFEADLRRLAQAQGGVVSLEQIVRTTGEPRGEVQQRMRALIGRGVFQLDVGDQGEMIFRLTPLDEARASLESLRER